MSRARARTRGDELALCRLEEVHVGHQAQREADGGRRERNAARERRGARVAEREHRRPAEKHGQRRAGGGENDGAHTLGAQDVGVHRQPALEHHQQQAGQPDRLERLDVRVVEQRGRVRAERHAHDDLADERRAADGVKGEAAAVERAGEGEQAVDLTHRGERRHRYGRPAERAPERRGSFTRPAWPAPLFLRVLVHVT
eukprot:5521526-Prymnesium_polylepis.1